MPPRLYHAVATIEFQPAVLQGAFFDSCYGIQHMLGGLIECAVWHTHWTNVLYTECPILLAYLLDWHAQAPPNNPRFIGENLYALLFAAKYSKWLVPIKAHTAHALTSFNPESIGGSNDPDGVHDFLLKRANQLLMLLPSHEQASYQHLEGTFKTYLASEYKAMCNLVIENESNTQKHVLDV